MSFENFLREYHATPTARLDGYSPSNFADLSEEERGQARIMLLQRGLAGDTIDIEGLRYVGDDQTIVALEAAKDRVAHFGSKFDIQRLETLFVLTGDRRHLQPLLVWIDGSDAAARRFAAEVLARHRLPVDLAAPIASRLTDGAHEDVARQLLEAWFATRGELIGTDLTAFHRRLPLIRAICASRPAARTGLLP